MSFDLARALRRIRPQRAASPIERRAFEAVPQIALPIAGGAELLLDTCVYIDVLQGRSPLALDALLEARIVNHSAVCLSELTHLFGRLDPSHPGTKAVLGEIRTTIEDILAHRLSSPSETAMGEAGMLAGLVTRLAGRQRAERPALLNDASLYLHALERGWTLVTRNLRDFDYFDQLVPADRVLFYEQAA